MEEREEAEFVLLCALLMSETAVVCAERIVNQSGNYTNTPVW